MTDVFDRADLHRSIKARKPRKRLGFAALVDNADAHKKTRRASKLQPEQCRFNGGLCETCGGGKIKCYRDGAKPRIVKGADCTTRCVYRRELDKGE